MTYQHRRSDRCVIERNDMKTNVLVNWKIIVYEAIRKQDIKHQFNYCTAQDAISSRSILITEGTLEVFDGGSRTLCVYNRSYMFIVLWKPVKHKHNFLEFKITNMAIVQFFEVLAVNFKLREISTCRYCVEIQSV